MDVRDGAREAIDAYIAGDMNATRGADPREVVAGRAAGYGWERNAHRNCAPLTSTATFSAGSLLSSAHDLTLWDAALRDDSLLPRARREEMWTGATLADGPTARRPDGYGWGVHPDYLGRRLVEHSGGTGGFSSHLARFLDDDLSVIVVANLRAAEAREIARKVAGLIVPALKPPPPAPVEDKEPGVVVLVAEVLRAVADGSLGPERFTPDLWASIFPDRVREGAGALTPLGALESVTLTAVGQATDGAGQRSYRYRAAFVGGDILVMLRLDPDGRIAGLQLAPG